MRDDKFNSSPENIKCVTVRLARRGAFWHLARCRDGTNLQVKLQVLIYCMCMLRSSTE